jgi:hypothetical protein
MYLSPFHWWSLVASVCLGMASFGTPLWRVSRLTQKWLLTSWKQSKKPLDRNNLGAKAQMEVLLPLVHEEVFCIIL